jgi:hypothetical protein
VGDYSKRRFCGQVGCLSRLGDRQPWRWRFVSQWCRLAAVLGAYSDMIVYVNIVARYVVNIKCNKIFVLYQESIIPALPLQACFLHGYVA